MNIRQARLRTGGAALLAVCVAGGLSAGASSAHQTAAAAAAGSSSTWRWPGADLSNTRDVKSSINAKNVSSLGLAWSLPIKATGVFGAYATTPVVVGGTMYTQDLASNVFAINPTLGEDPVGAQVQRGRHGARRGDRGQRHRLRDDVDEGVRASGGDGRAAVE